ncbi:phytanoyl-CoA dioxygenase family protein (plasmid) [Burkholderia pyrrocinia]|uniref:phytanoyl-CoA dioxygenase family protein n=1 Tax=Burkholderia pyrrocinia TaxID=60550 RepID=UPI0038B62429
MNTPGQPWTLVKRILVDDREIGAARAYCQSLLHAPTHRPPLIAYCDEGGESRRLVRIERFAEDFGERTGIDLHARCNALAQGLLGRPCRLFKDKINFRYPASPGFKAHQDAAAGWNRYASRYATIAVLIEASQPDSGGFEFATGSSPGYLYPNRNGQLDDALFASLRPQSLDVDAGDGLLFDGYAPHRTYANQSVHVVPHLFLTFNCADEGDFRERYYAEKIAGMTSHGDGYAFRLFDFGPEGAMR